MQMKKSSSYYYWKAREQAQDQLYKAEEERYLQYINRQYDRAMDQIQKEIDSFYAKYATSEGISIAEAKRRVSKLDIEEYSRKAEKYVKDKNFTKKANEEMRLYNATMRINRLEMLKANIGLETVSAQNDVEKYLDEILEGRTREEIEHQSGILGQSVNTNTDKAIAAIVNGSFMNSKYAAKWSDTLWKNQTLLKSELDRLLTKGLTQGKSSRALASELRKSINAEKSVAERLMRTELARVSIESGLSLMEENDYDEYMYMTLSFKDGKICDACKALDGKHFKRKDAEVGFNLPPMHPNCRCSIAPYEDDNITGSEADKLNGVFTNNASGGKIDVANVIAEAQEVWEAKRLIDKFKMPKKYKAHIKQAIEVADIDAVRAFNKWASPSSLVDELQKWEYSPTDKKVHLDILEAWKDPRQLKTLFFHEYGHLIDNYAYKGSAYNGWVSSQTAIFGQLLAKDFDEYIKKYKKQHNIKTTAEAYKKISNELKTNVKLAGGYKLNGVSDMLGGLSGNGIEGFAHHDDVYWAKAGSIERESFAHMYMSLFDPDKIKIMEEYFPRAYREFRIILKGV